MKYAILIYAPEDGTAPDPAITEEYMQLAQRESTVGGEQLQTAATATTVRVTNGETLTTDGPFVETKESVGGFDLIECRSFEEAVEIAASHPIAAMGAIEVRPLWGK